MADEADSTVEEESLLTKIKPWVSGVAQILGWLYSMAALAIMISLFGSIITDTFSSCSYGVSLLYKTCLIQSFPFLDEVNAFHARVQSCSDPGAGRICIADFERTRVDQQCTVGSQASLNRFDIRKLSHLDRSQALSSLSGKGDCGCKMTTMGKTSDSAVDAAIRAYYPSFATTSNNAVYCYSFEIPDVIPVRVCFQLNLDASNCILLIR